jgi:subtilase family serine protease
MTRYPLRRFFPILILSLLLLAGCSSLGPLGTNTTPTPAKPSSSATAGVPNPNGATPTLDDTCPIPGLNSGNGNGVTCLTPHQLRVAFGVESLIEQGYTGKGQTIIDIVSFGSPTLQQDMDTFDQQFGLPPIKIQVISNVVNEPTYDPNNDRGGWAQETELDVQIIHSIAPGANIIVMTSPVAETEGTVGLPEFLQLEQYALSHHLGNIVSQSWGASEVTLKDTAGQQELQKWNTFFQQATTQQGMTFFGSSGDNGATDYTNLQATKLSPTATTSFPADNPWVTACGGTTITQNGGTYQETAWSGSGGGFSSFYAAPSYQQLLPASDQSELNHRRGVPDVSAPADPSTGLAIYFQGQWGLAGGTSASAPFWASLQAIANQMAGHPLGFINPALYKLGTSSQYNQDFSDITSGNNSVNSHGVNVQGYSATTGWDPITGLGSPIANKLIPALINMMKSST